MLHSFYYLESLPREEVRALVYWQIKESVLKLGVPSELRSSADALSRARLAIISIILRGQNFGVGRRGRKNLTKGDNQSGSSGWAERRVVEQSKVGKELREAKVEVDAALNLFSRRRCTYLIAVRPQGDGGARISASGSPSPEAESSTLVLSEPNSSQFLPIRIGRTKRLSAHKIF